MLFNTYAYVFFLIMVYFLYHCLNHRKQNFMLLTASYVFYGSWSVKFLSLIMLSTIVDFFCARNIALTSEPAKRKRLLFISVCANMGLLGVFKYYNFFIGSFVEFLRWFQIDISVPILEIVLPVGISFYTFQTMAYTIDVYRKEIDPIENFFDFALFVSFFPQLVAGPIERAHQLLPQITSNRTISWEKTSHGLYLLLIGFFKKAVIADNLAVVADKVFNNPADFNGIYILFGIYAFAIQIYCDFSGYTDIARGTAKLFGIDLTINFRQPYLAKNPQDFWNRWHISLTSWIRDYVFFPFLTSLLRFSTTNAVLKRNLAVIITMTLIGLWHGAGWNFIVFGMYWGILIVIYNSFKKSWKNIGDMFGRHQQLWNAICVIFMFHLTCIGYVLFRANDFTAAMNLLSMLINQGGLLTSQAKDLLLVVFLAIPLFVAHSMEKDGDAGNYMKGMCFRKKVNWVSFTLLMLIFWSSHENVPFIYFQF